MDHSPKTFSDFQGPLCTKRQWWKQLHVLTPETSTGEMLQQWPLSHYITKAADITKNIIMPAPVAQWLARRTVGRKVWGSNPIRVMWDFSALAGSYPELGVLWAQWEGWNHTAELHPLNGCVFEGVALITWPTLQVPQFPGLVNTGIIVTVSVVCGPAK